MELKTCFKCNVAQPRSEFYRHSKMADGLLGKCKTCTKRDIAEHRQKQPDVVHGNDRKRELTPRRKRWKINYQRYRRTVVEPEKYKARGVVARATRSGKLERQPCRICGAKAEAHHHDYAKPLEVDWLCRTHHMEEHRKEKEKYDSK